MPPPSAPLRSRPALPAAFAKEPEPEGGAVPGSDLCGQLVDLTYTKPRRRTVRVRVMRYIEERGVHVVTPTASSGARNGDGIVLEEVDLNAMHAAGLMRFVDPKFVGEDGWQEAGAHTRAPLYTEPSPRREAPAKKPPQAASGKSGGVLASKRQRTMPTEHEPADLCGEVVDLHYPEGTFRTFVQSYSEATGWHNVTSEGYSIWDGEDFQDEVDLVGMLAEGSATIVKRPRRAEDEERPKAAAASSSGKGRGGPAGRGRVRSRDVRASAPPGKRRKAQAAAASAEDAAAHSVFGFEMVNRVLDVAHTNDELAIYRVVVKAYNDRTRKHLVQSHPAPEDSPPEVQDWLDLNGLRSLGRLQIVDGLDELRRDGHALVGEDISFLPKEVAADDEANQVWVKAKVTGWWPQKILPPITLNGTTDDVRQAIFVAEDQAFTVWQLSLPEAMLAYRPKTRADSQPTRALFEVFAGSCELSLAFRRHGLDTEAYDIQLCSDDEFVEDEKLLLRLEEEPPWEIVHFAPPASPSSSKGEDAVAHERLVAKLADMVRRLNDLGRGFLVECGVSDPFWRSEVMQSLPDSVKSLECDLDAYGGLENTRVRLLTNRPATFERLASAPKAARQITRRSAAARATLGTPEDRRYPRSFCDVYAECVVKSLSRGAPSARSSSPAHEPAERTAERTGKADEKVIQEAAEPCPQQHEPESEEVEMEEATAKAFGHTAMAVGSPAAEPSAASGEVAPAGTTPSLTKGELADGVPHLARSLSPPADGDGTPFPTKKQAAVEGKPGSGACAGEPSAQGEEAHRRETPALVAAASQDSLDSLIREEEDQGSPSAAVDGS